jgi:hypothetical protein
MRRPCLDRLRRATRSLALVALAVPAYAWADSEHAPVTFAPTRSVLVLIPAAQATQLLSDHRPPGVDASSQSEQDLLRECANGETQRSQSSRFFLLSIASQAWQILLHPLSVSVHDELLKYARVSDANASGDYYKGGAGAPSAPLTSRISCVRFTRYAQAEAGASDEPGLDFVASVRLDSTGDAIRLRPLRLYISQAAAKSANSHYAVAVAVRADAVWRDEFAGHQGRIFEQTVLAENIDLKGGAVLKYYPTDAAAGTRVPIVPVSFGTDRSQDFGRAEFGVSVAELGTPPETLKLLSEMLPDPNQKLSKLVVAAALAGVGLQQ